MRKIKFRGKLVFDGNISDMNKWVYGYYIVIARQHLINMNNANYKVRPESC